MFKNLIRKIRLIGTGEMRENFLENLSMMIASGMNILEALNTVEKQMQKTPLKKEIAFIKNQVESGAAFWESLQKTELFPSYILSLIRVGEESGKLPENLRIIVIQQRKDRLFKSKIRSAMMYPAFVLFVMLVIGIGIAWYILPKLATIFRQLRVELPLLTEWLIISGEFLREWGLIAIPLFFVIIALLLYFIFFFSKSRFIGQAILLHTPVIKHLVKNTELARLGYIFGTLLDAGLPIDQALNSLISATEFKQYRKFYEFTADYIKQGKIFSNAFSDYKKTNMLIPPTIQNMVISASRSGKLEETFLQIGEIYEEKLGDTTKNLTIILEPVLLVIVWVGVVMVALAVILPIYSLIGGFNEITGGGGQSAGQSTAPVEIETLPSEETANETEETSASGQIEENEENSQQLPQLEILETETGFLNVRQDPNTASEIITQVLPGEFYPYDREQNNWFHIILDEETAGWVFGQFVQTSE